MKPKLVYTLLLLAAVFVVYVDVRDFALLTWDDNINVTMNPSVANATLGGLADIWRAPYANLYVPVAYSWYWCLATVSHWVSPGAELDAHVFHFGNLVLHALASWLVFRILTRFVANERAAFVGALVFALHPLATESVAWVTEARGLLCAVLSFAALDLWLQVARGEARAQPVRAHWRLALSTLFFAAALLAKPQAVTLPLVALFLDRFVVGRAWKRSLPLALAWLALAAGAIWLTKSQQSDETLRFVAPIGWRPIVALDAIGFYATKVLVPIGLATDYGRTPQWLLESTARAWPALVALALFAITLWVRPARRFHVCVVVFCVLLLPVLGLVTFGYQDISTVADRYAYPALLGVALAVAWIVERSTSVVQWSTAAVLAIVLGVLAGRQADTWRSNETLFARVLEVNPRSWKAYSNLALAATRQGRLDEAVAQYRRALELGPSRWIVHQNLGLVLCQKGQTLEGEQELARSFELRRENLAVAGMLGSVRLSLGRYADAEDPLRVAVLLDPQRADVTECLGAALLAQGKDAESIGVLRRALELRDSAETRKNLAQALLLTGDVRGAISELRRALVLKPGWPDAEFDLAWLLATSADDALRNGAEALTLAEHASQASKQKSPRDLDTLAASLAAAGRFDEAVQTVQSAQKLIGTTNPAITAKLEAHRLLYAEKRALRDSAR